MTPDGTRRESPGTRASICRPSILIVTSRPGPTVAKGRLRSGSGRLPRSVGTQSSQPVAKGSRRVDPTHGAMSQRQVLQGRELWTGAPTGWRRGGDGGEGGGCSTLPLSPVFELYQNARTRFVQMVAEQATRPQNIETLQNAGEPELRPAPLPHTSSFIHPRPSTNQRQPHLVPGRLLAPLSASLPRPFTRSTFGSLGNGLK